MSKLLNPDAAVGLAVNQYMFVNQMSGASLATILGVSAPTATRKLRGQVGWSFTELLTVAEYFGIEMRDLIPLSDGNGGWIPAPYVVPYKEPRSLAGVGSAKSGGVVPQAGLEPATDEL